MGVMVIHSGIYMSSSLVPVIIQSLKGVQSVNVQLQANVNFFINEITYIGFSP